MESMFKVIVRRIPKQDEKTHQQAVPNDQKISIIDWAQNVQYEEKKKDSEIGKNEPNIIIYAKNIETLDEYSLYSVFQEEHYQQLERWVQKKKYTCKILEDDEGRPVELVVNIEIFSFTLRKLKKKEEKLLQEELIILRKQNEKIKKEIKLFNFYFFAFWNEKIRSKVNQMKVITADTQSDKKPNAGSMESVYTKVKAIGHVMEDSNRNKRFYLGIEVPLQAQPETKKVERIYNQIGDKQFMREVIVWGKGLNHGIAHINEETSETITLDDKKTYLHQVDIRVTNMSTYTLWIPKLPS